MRIHRTLHGVIAVTAALLFVASPTDAASRSRREIRVSEGTRLQGNAVPAGSYTLSWDGESDSDEVKVTIAQGKKVVASATGRWIKQADASPYESIAERTGDGARELVEIRFAGKKEAIRIDEAGAVAAGGAASGN